MSWNSISFLPQLCSDFKQTVNMESQAIMILWLQDSSNVCNHSLIKCIKFLIQYSCFQCLFTWAFYGKGHLNQPRCGDLSNPLTICHSFMTYMPFLIGPFIGYYGYLFWLSLLKSHVLKLSWVAHINCHPNIKTQ